MLDAFWMSWLGWLHLGLRLCRAVPAEGLLPAPRRLLLFALLWPAFGILLCLHWLGFLLDELLFRGYRRVRVEAPLFIVGVPRSGTTYLQRLLAREPGLTSLTTFECLLAPSVSERYLWTALGRLASRLPGLARTRQAGGRATGFLARMDAIHRIRLHEPEEDFLLLLYVQSCFLAVLPCPRDAAFWRLARFDTEVGVRRRRRVLKFYRRCLQKHLYFHGGGRLLSKNPSFTPMLQSLREEFRDGSFVACVRRPEEAVPSQLNSLVPALQLLGGAGIGDDFAGRLLEVLHGYYRRLAQFSREDSLFMVDTERLRGDLERLLEELSEFAGLEPTADLAGIGRRLAEEEGYQGARRYRLEEFGLHEAEITRRFRDVWRDAGVCG